jgi:hypothetical protein
VGLEVDEKIGELSTFIYLHVLWSTPWLDVHPSMLCNIGLWWGYTSVGLVSSFFNIIGVFVMWISHAPLS